MSLDVGIVAVIMVSSFAIGLVWGYVGDKS